MSKLQDYSGFTYGVHAWGWYDDEDLIFGSSFNDDLEGASGNDEIFGGDGNDRISDVATSYYWLGPASLFLPSDDDGLPSQPTRLDLAHQAEANTAEDRDGDWYIGIHGLQFHEGGNDRFFGGRGDDFLAGYSGNDHLDGGDDNDRAFGGTGDDVVIGGAGDDDLGGNSGNDILLGGAGADILLGGTGADFLQGGLGADVIEGGDLAANAFALQVAQGIFTQAQANAMIAAANAGDTVNYDNSLRVDIDLERATQLGGESDGDTITGVENIDGSRFGDTLRGDNKANVLFGNLGSDTLEGRGGADVLIGGDGIDTASYESSTGRVNVDLTRGTGQLGEAAGDTLTSIESLTGSRFDDTLAGDDAAVGNRIDGGDGNDTISGRNGTDTLNGGNGIDTLDGGNDNDVLDGGLGNDILIGGLGVDTAEFDSFDTIASSGTLQFAPRISIDLANGLATKSVLNFQTFRFDIIEQDTLSGIENARGSNNADLIIGNAQNNTFSGRDGNDTFKADAGSDSYNGDGGTDTVDYSSSSAVTVNLNFGIAGSGGLAQGDLYNSIENVIGTSGRDTITGNNSNNRLEGGAGGDTLNGGGGSDTLIGGAGVGLDLLTGAQGADTFLYRSIDDSRVVNRNVQDNILDFEVGVDKLDFKAFAVNAAKVLIINQAGSAVVGVDLNDNGLLDEGDFAISVAIQNNQPMSLTDILV